MSYCVARVVLYLYGSLPPVVFSLGWLMSYSVVLFFCTCTGLYLPLLLV
jgi:hypothetical protein